jgi:hypothetical protein
MSDRDFAKDDRDSYFAALAAKRLRDLLEGKRWPGPEDTFDLILAAAWARGRR